MSVDANPQAWWQHAGRAVLSERALALGSESSRCDSRHRREFRQLYNRFYLRRRSLLSWLLDMMQGNPHATRDALLHLEAQLGESEIAQFRWWAWAAQKRRSQVGQPRPSSAQRHRCWGCETQRGQQQQRPGKADWKADVCSSKKFAQTMMICPVTPKRK